MYCSKPPVPSVDKTLPNGELLSLVEGLRAKGDGSWVSRPASDQAKPC